MPEPRLLLGKCEEQMRTLDENSVDGIVTDPPYALPGGFMNKEWDNFASGRDFEAWCETWAREAYRVLKPGGYLLAFGSARTFHRLACGIEDAGFELRPALFWHYGTGRPAGSDVSKQIDQHLGAERVETPVGKPMKRMIPGAQQNATGSWIKSGEREYQPVTSLPATDAAARWEGWNTALKPATEPIVVARKPLVGTIAENTLTWGVGGLNIDATRIPVNGSRPGRVGFGDDTPGKTLYGSGGPGGGSAAVDDTDLGRWPGDILLTHSPACRPAGTRQVRSNSHHPSARPAGGIGSDGHKGQTDLVERRMSVETVEHWVCDDACPVRIMDDQSGPAGAAGDVAAGLERKTASGIYGELGATVFRAKRDDEGGASRFFARSHWSIDDLDADFMYQAKAPQRERPEVDGVKHIAVKPLELMRWLCRLIIPAGGVVLDPFAGSGPTIEAALIEGMHPIGIDEHAPYHPLIEQRIERFRRGETKGYIPASDPYFDIPAKRTPIKDDSGQLDLFAAAS